MDHYDIIVIGGGSAGPTLAWSLEKSGKRVLIIDNRLERAVISVPSPKNWGTAPAAMKPW